MDNCVLRTQGPMFSIVVEIVHKCLELVVSICLISCKNMLVFVTLNYWETFKFQLPCYALS
jgi:hypothetical protein